MPFWPPVVITWPRIVWFRSLIEYLRLMLNIGSYSRAFNFSGNKKCNHSNRTSCAARDENEKSFIGRKLSRPHFPRIAHLCFTPVTSHRRPSSLRLRLQLFENPAPLRFYLASPPPPRLPSTLPTLPHSFYNTPL